MGVVRYAFAISEINLNEQRKNLAKYIVPAMVSNLGFFILTIVDGMFVGNGIGPDALGAVSLAMPFANIVWTVVTLFNIGGGTVASVRLGRGDVDGANQVFMHSLLANIVILSAVSSAGMLFPQQIAVILGANETYLSMVSDYIFWYSVFLLTTVLGACLNTFARNDGNPGLSIVMTAVMTTANIFGDWLMVYPLKKRRRGRGDSDRRGELPRVPRGAVTLHTEKGQTALPPFQTSALTLPKDNPPRRPGDDLAVREPDHHLLNEQYAHNAPREHRGECVFSDHLRELAVLFPDLGSRERSPAALRRELRREG